MRRILKNWITKIKSGKPNSHIFFPRKAWGIFCRHFLYRSIPHGVVGIQYLFPGRSHKLKTHFRIWLQSLPKLPLPFFLLLEFFLWLRWVMFSGWRNTLRCVQKMGPEFKKQYGVGLFLQFRQILFLSLFYCIPPCEIYTFRLIKSKNSQGACILDYIFTNELPGFHRWRSSMYGQNRESITLLQDKYRLTSYLEKRGVPMVPIVKVLHPKEFFDFFSCFQEFSRLLCKPRNGSAGKGIFVVTSKDEGKQLEVFKTISGVITSQTTYSCLKKAFCMNDYLVQPFVINHPVLADLCNTLDAVTIRIITELKPHGSYSCFCAMLEVPVVDVENPEFKPPLHVILPIDFNTGKIKPFPGYILNMSAKLHYDRVCAEMNKHSIPFWIKMRESAINAHGLFSDIYAIAWDFVVNSDGHFLLEGNIGWGCKMPQIITGGLLKNTQCK